MSVTDREVFKLIVLSVEVMDADVQPSRDHIGCSVSEDTPDHYFLLNFQEESQGWQRRIWVSVCWFVGLVWYFLPVSVKLMCLKMGPFRLNLGHKEEVVVCEEVVSRVRNLPWFHPECDFLLSWRCSALSLSPPMTLWPAFPWPGRHLGLVSQKWNVLLHLCLCPLLQRARAMGVGYQKRLFVFLGQQLSLRQHTKAEITNDCKWGNEVGTPKEKSNTELEEYSLLTWYEVVFSMDVAQNWEISNLLL